MTDTEREFAELYGPTSPHRDYQPGEIVHWMEEDQLQAGEVLHVVAATENQPVMYVVSPKVGLFPIEIAAHEIVEP